MKILVTEGKHSIVFCSIACLHEPCSEHRVRDVGIVERWNVCQVPAFLPEHNAK